MNLTIKISNTQRNCEDVVKLLGVDIDYQRNFYQHISYLCRKAGQQLNVLTRLSPFYQDKINLQFSILLYYLILITARLPGMFVMKVTLKKLEKIQERALRFVYDDFKSKSKVYQLMKSY